LRLSKDEKARRKEARRIEKWKVTHKIIDGVDHKVCNKCKEFKPSNQENFYPNKYNSLDGLYPYCRICAIKKSSDYQDEHKEMKLESARKYNNRPEIKEINRVHKRNYRKSGKYKIWLNSNKGKTKVYRLDRYKKKKHDITDVEWTQCKEYFDNSCAYCGHHKDNHFKKWNGKSIKTDLHKEHVDDNGANDLSNCIPACNSCNSQKWTFALDEWYTTDNAKYSYKRYKKINKWLNVDYKQYIKS
jgi:hypothetical protein